MSLSIAAAPGSTPQPAWYTRQASYPPLTTAPANPTISSMPAQASVATVPAGQIPSVEIPAPPLEAQMPARDARLVRSAKGELYANQGAAAPPTATEASDSFSFSDLIDVVNPLQHIPGVSWVYQHLTGDTIKPAENVAGGFLYGGPLGGMLALGMSCISELQAGSQSTDDHDGAAAIADTSATSAYRSKFDGAAAPGVFA